MVLETKLIKAGSSWRQGPGHLEAGDPQPIPSCRTHPATWPRTVWLLGNHKVALVPPLLVSKGCSFISLTPDTPLPPTLPQPGAGCLGFALYPTPQEPDEAFLLFCTKLPPLCSWLHDSPAPTL